MVDKQIMYTSLFEENCAKNYQSSEKPNKNFAGAINGPLSTYQTEANEASYMCRYYLTHEDSRIQIPELTDAEVWAVTLLMWWIFL